jgi:hypothetical protein
MILTYAYNMDFITRINLNLIKFLSLLDNKI